MITLIDRLLQSRWIATLRVAQFFLAIVIFTSFALMPSSYVSELDQSDHTLHLLGNFLLFVSASIASFGRLKLGMLIVLLVPYSLLIELAQWLAPSRHVDYHDMVFNIAGLFAGFLVVEIVEWGWRRIKRRQKPNL